MQINTLDCDRYTSAIFCRQSSRSLTHRYYWGDLQFSNGDYSQIIFIDADSYLADATRTLAQQPVNIKFA